MKTYLCFIVVDKHYPWLCSSNYKYGTKKYNEKNCCLVYVGSSNSALSYHSAPKYKAAFLEKLKPVL
jgi:hypothetical protein